MAKLKKLVQEGEYSIGDPVLVGTAQESGIIKFVGNTQFSQGEWVGVELEKPQGKNDGTVQGVVYFECKPKHGIFVRKAALLRPKQAEEVVKASKEKEPKTTAKTKGAKALMSGLKSGEVGKIVGNMEDQGLPISPNTTNKENGNATAKPKAAKAEATRSGSKSQSPKATVELDDQAAAALKDLRQAVEEHNPDVLRKALILAESKGVPEIELGSAHRLLAFETQKLLSGEIGRVRNVVAGLAEVVRLTQEKAKAAEESAKSAHTENWVNNLAKRIEGRVWEGLQKKVEERIESTVRAVSQEMLSGFSKSPPVVSKTLDQDARNAAATRIQSIQRGRVVRKRPRGQEAQNVAATKIQIAWRRKIARSNVDPNTRSFDMIVKAARKRNEAWAGIFDHFCAEFNADALELQHFHCAITEIHPRLSQGQRNILFKGYTDGTGRRDIDLVGFLGMCEAIAVDDHAAAEFADVNVETFQSLGKAGSDEAAMKIQCAQRQRAARSEVSSRKQAKEEKLGATTSLLDFVARIDEATPGQIADALNSLTGSSRARLAGHIGGTDSKARRWQYSEEQAAVMIQRWTRRRLAGIKNDPFAMSIRRVKLRHEAWCSAYEEVCAGNAGLDKDRFERTIEMALPNRLSAGQKRVLYQGYVEGTGKDSIDMVAFCCIASAVAAGDNAAAEYADINLHTFQVLGQKSADEAATKIGAVVRGRQTRTREQVGR